MLDRCEVRSWKLDDATSLARQANDRAVWRNLRDGFPHPYALDDAEAFIRRAMARSPETVFAIAVEGEAVGGIGFMLGTDVERVAAEIGYWLGRELWGRGIVTEALAAVTRHAVETYRLTRAERHQRRPGHRPDALRLGRIGGIEGTAGHAHAPEKETAATGLAESPARSAHYRPVTLPRPIASHDGRAVDPRSSSGSRFPLELAALPRTLPSGALAGEVEVVPMLAAIAWRNLGRRRWLYVSRVSFAHGPAILLGTYIVMLLAGVLPALKASRLEVVQAMRHK